MAFTVRIACGALLLLCAGCQSQEELRYVTGPAVEALDASLQESVQLALSKNFGTPLRPKLPGHEKLDPQHLLRGAEVYRDRCAACHGVTGDGQGPAAAFLQPRPRDYRRGRFKFTSTADGAKPLRADLRRTIVQGARGTSMPSFKLLQDHDLEAVLDYVLSLTWRGEAETLLAARADSEGELTDDAVQEELDAILSMWRDAKSSVVIPLTQNPPITAETILAGKQAFLTEQAACFKCHGADGHGKTSDNDKGFDDEWGFKTRAADLTAGMFHGGGTPEDIYQRIYAGIKGGGMPSFAQKLSAQPETIWHLVHYVQFVSGARRREVAAVPFFLPEVATEEASPPDAAPADGANSPDTVAPDDAPETAPPDAAEPAAPPTDNPPGDDTPPPGNPEGAPATDADPAHDQASAPSMSIPGASA